MSFTKIRIAVEKYAGKKTVFTPFVIVAGLTFAAVGTSLVLGGCTPGVPVTDSSSTENGGSSTPEISTSSKSVDEESIVEESMQNSNWSSIDAFDLDATAKYVKDTCTKFNKDISDVEAKDVAELAQKLSIFATHAKSDITNGATDSIIAKNKEQIADETLADKVEEAEKKDATELDINGEKINVKLIRLA